MRIETRTVNDVLAVHLTGRLDSFSAATVGDRLTALADGGRPRILLNMTGVEYVSSAGLRMLLRAAKLHEAQGGGIALCGAGGMVAEVLATSGFDNLLAIFATEAEALAASG